MTAIADRFSFKALLAILPRGEPLDTAFLKEKGLSPSHAAHLAKAGWLTHLGRGVYMLPGDTLSRDGCLVYLMRRNEGLHVGGRTALAWRGIKHNIASREVIKEQFGGDIKVWARSPSYFADVMTNNPFRGKDPAKLYFTLLEARPEDALLQSFHALNHAPDQVSVAGEMAYVLCATKSSDSGSTPRRVHDSL